GYCWAFLGPRGHIAFALSEPIVVTDFTIFYANPDELTTKELQQAPKIIQLWALSAPKSPQDVVQQKLLLANVSFTLQQGTKQTFSVESPTESLTTVVVIEVLDNWGSETTCLYRIAIHGQIPS
ncbi:SUN domain-containing protein, partial [Lentinula edodes]